MGFLRKAMFVGTGGASGLVVKANSKKERTANAAEKQLRLQGRQESGQVVTTGGWWLDPGVFKGLGVWGGFLKTQYLDSPKYLGKTKTLNFLPAGVEWGAAAFKLDWSRVKDIEIEDREGKAAVIVRTWSGEADATFLMTLSPDAARGKLANLLGRMHDSRALASGSGEEQSFGSVLGTADELAKLAQLRDSGVLTEEEFSAQKAKLLNT